VDAGTDTGVEAVGPARKMDSGRSRLDALRSRVSLVKLASWRLTALLAALGAIPLPASLGRAQVPLVDHHQHIASPTNAQVLGAPGAPRLPNSAQALIAYLDSAGIQRALVLSVAYQYGNPSRNVENEYRYVKAENNGRASRSLSTRNGFARSVV